MNQLRIELIKLETNDYFVNDAEIQGPITIDQGQIFFFHK